MGMDKLKEQQKRRLIVWRVIGIFAVVLIISGLGFAFVQLMSSDGQLFTTPTPTATFTRTPVLPTSTIFVSPAPTSTLTPTLTPTRSGPTIHVVEEGESLFFLAGEYEIDINILIAYNLEEGGPDLREAILQIGDEVLIPPPEFEIEIPTETPVPDDLLPGTIIEYVIKPGDLLGFVAEEFNTTVDAILEENDIDDPNQIGVGEVIRIPYNLITLTPITPTATRPPTRTPTAEATTTPPVAATATAPDVATATLPAAATATATATN